MFRIKRDYPVFIVILCMILLISVGWYSIFHISDSIQGLYASYLNETAKNYGKDLKKNISEIVEETNQLATFLPIEHMLISLHQGEQPEVAIEDVSAFFDRYLISNKDIYGVYLTDGKQNLIAEAEKEKTEDNLFSQQANVYQADDYNVTRVKLVNEHDKIYSLIHKEYYHQGRYIGSLIVIEKLAYIMEQIDNFELGKTGNIYVLNQNLESLLWQDQLEGSRGTGEDDDFYEKLKEHIEKKKSGAFEYTQMEERPVKRLANYYTVDEYGFTVVATIDKKEVMATPLKININIVVMFLVFFISVGTMHFLRTTQFIRPIKEMIDIAQELERGNYHIRFSLQGKEKLAVFAQGINRILDDLEEERQKYRLVAENVSDIIWELDLKTMMVKHSHNFVEQLGWNDVVLTYDEFQRTLVHPDDVKVMDEYGNPVFSGEKERFEYEIRVKHKQGGYCWMHCVGGVVTDVEGCPITVIGSARNIQAEKDNTIKLLNMTMIDPMTGVYNKIHGQQQIEQLMKNNDMAQALLLVDLDHFKEINDQYGHLCGDYVIKAIANRLKKNIGEENIVVRFGGDEFIVYLVGQEEQIEQEIEQLFYIINQAYFYEGKQITVSCTIGYAWYRKQGASYEELLNQADQALYNGKGKGKMCIECIE